jgi:hypothetical protein
MTFFPFDTHNELQQILVAVSTKISLPSFQYLYYRRDSSSCEYFMAHPVRALG